MKVSVWHPSLTDREHEAVRRVLDIGYLGMGSEVFAFERAASEILSVSESEVVSAHTGQSALHLALLAIGVGPGDTVITPSFNNVADFQAILACGATPFFCDINPDTGLIDVMSLESCPLDTAKCVIALDYASLYCDLAAIAALCKHHDTKLIYDAAHTFGCTTPDRLRLADATMFSFDPIKTLTAIDAGIIHSASPEVIDRIRKTRHMGMEQNLEALKKNQRSWGYDVKLPGYRYHLSNVHAAIGLAQIERFEEISEKRNRCFNRLRAKCGELGEHFGFLPIDDGFVPFMNVAVVNDSLRDPLRSHLEARDIQTGIHWTPGHHFTLFANTPRAPLPGTEIFHDRVVSLPLFTDMTDEQIDYVSNALVEFFNSGT